MSKLPSSFEISHKANLLPGVPQHGDWWCIPASIENMLRFVGYNKLTQEELIFEYIRHFPRPLSLSNGADLRIFPQSQMLRALQHTPLPDANFNSFSKVARLLLQHQLPEWDFRWINNVTNEASYIHHLKESISSDSPTLISVGTQGAWHIVVVFAFTDDIIEAYDPATNTVLSKSTNQFQFSNDLLVLERVNSSTPRTNN